MIYTLAIPNYKPANISVHPNQVPVGSFPMRSYRIPLWDALTFCVCKHGTPLISRQAWIINIINSSYLTLCEWYLFHINTKPRPKIERNAWEHSQRTGKYNGLTFIAFYSERRNNINSPELVKSLMHLGDHILRFDLFGVHNLVTVQNFHRLRNRFVAKRHSLFLTVLNFLNRLNKRIDIHMCLF